MSHLRFTSDEFHAIHRACRSVRLTDDFFPDFRSFLVDSLGEAWPHLAERVANFRKSELRLLYKHLRRPNPRRSEALSALTPEELRKVSGACNASVGNVRFVALFKNLLVYMFQSSSPALAKKLARLSDSEFVRLYELLQGRSA